MESELFSRLKAIGAELPVANPQFDPANPPLGSREVVIATETGKEEATASVAARTAGLAKTKIDPLGPYQLPPNQIGTIVPNEERHSFPINNGELTGINGSLVFKNGYRRGRVGPNCIMV